MLSVPANSIKGPCIPFSIAVPNVLVVAAFDFRLTIELRGPNVRYACAGDSVIEAEIPERLLRCRPRAVAASHGPKPLAH